MAIFRFKQFVVDDTHCAMKVGTDGVVLGAWVDSNNAQSILDIGCGSGLIALMLAQRCDAKITAVDIDNVACDEAHRNFEASPWRERLTVEVSSFEKFLPKLRPDLIVSNPPFFADGELSPEKGRATARHEASLNYRTLIDYAAEHLASTGRLAFIYQYGREDEVIYKAEMSHLKLRRICHLRQAKDRLWIRTLYTFSRIDGEIERSTITIKTCDGLTPTMIDLCKDYYLEL